MTIPIESRIRLFRGDITSLQLDAIVTAANESLCGGGGVDGAVHNAAGPELLHASMALAPCPAGCTRITGAFNLNAKFVIHAVGPIFRDLETDRETLWQTYNSSLSIAAENGVGSIAFPCISTGAFGFPAKDACEVAIQSVLKWFRGNDNPEHVTFCCFEQEDHTLYEQRLGELGLYR